MPARGVVPADWASTGTRRQRQDDEHDNCNRPSHCTTPSKLAEPRPVGPCPVQAHAPGPGHVELRGRAIATRHIGLLERQPRRHHHPGHRHRGSRMDVAHSGQPVGAPAPELDGERVAALAQAA